MSSTLFLPTVAFESLSTLKPLTAEKLLRVSPDLIAYTCEAGDMAIFSGKKTHGEKDDRFGALHISPEGFHDTERLSFLIRLRHDP
jgi:hypothetical protein